MDRLPMFQLVIDESMESDLQVDYVALVDNPAIEKNFLAFKDKICFDLSQQDRHIISGPAMLADTPIYRRDEQLGEYFVTFKPETVYQIAQKFFQKGYQQNFNLFHDNTNTTGVTVFESFITDTSRGINPMKGFEDAPNGSWFISAKVDNLEVWNAIKTGTVKGFSVEGLFKYKKQQMSEQQVFEKLLKLLEDF
jgi:hypothetical protein